MGQYDAALKHSLTAFPGDWARFVGVPPGIAVEPVDTDLSSVSQQLDKLLRVHVDPPYLLHIEPHSYYDEELDTRILQYQATARHRLKQEVHTAVLLLYPRAWGSRNRGRVQSASQIGHCRLNHRPRLRHARPWMLVLYAEGVGRSSPGSRGFASAPWVEYKVLRYPKWVLRSACKTWSIPSPSACIVEPRRGSLRFPLSTQGALTSFATLGYCVQRRWRKDEEPAGTVCSAH